MLRCELFILITYIKYMAIFIHCNEDEHKIDSYYTIICDRSLVGFTARCPGPTDASSSPAARECRPVDADNKLGLRGGEGASSFLTGLPD